MQFDIRRFDIYRKIPKDLTQPTLTGAIISICSCIFMSFLFLSELMSFITTDIHSELFVDDPATHTERIPVKVDLTLHNMQCEFVGLDIQDDLGRHEVGFVENIQKDPVRDDKGCRFRASFNINKVPGNFHVSTHAATKQPQKPDMSHTIHHVIFGAMMPEDISHLPGSFNPLEDKENVADNPLSSHDYYMKVVPTLYEDLSGRKVFPYQYTYAKRAYMQYGHGHRVVPAIWFRYDLSPITVKYVEKRRPLYSFLTSVCAIVGGTFTVAGIIDSMFFTATELFKKFEIGKLT